MNVPICPRLLRFIQFNLHLLFRKINVPLNFNWMHPQYRGKIASICIRTGYVTPTMNSTSVWQSVWQSTSIATCQRVCMFDAILIENHMFMLCTQLACIRRHYYIVVVFSLFATIRSILNAISNQSNTSLEQFFIHFFIFSCTSHEICATNFITLTNRSVCEALLSRPI